MFSSLIFDDSIEVISFWGVIVEGWEEGPSTNKESRDVLKSDIQ